MMNDIKKKKNYFHLDPRTKIILLALCVLTATMTPSLRYECILIAFIAVFGCMSGKIKYSLLGTIVFMCLYLLTILYLQNGTGIAYTMFTAWLSLFYKVYPCGFLAGIVLSTTKVNEFLSAMSKIHIPKKIVIPLTIMLRYFPTIREDWSYIKDAMRLREVSLSLKGLITNPSMTIECLYVPLMMTASKAADELSIAAMTRGIENPNPRTCLVQIKLRSGDIFVIICFLAIFVVGIFLGG